METPDSQVNQTGVQLVPGLYVVATPIGNLRDVTLRALDVLGAVDVIACEDTRITRRLLERYGITTPMISHHEHNAGSVRPKLLARLQAGQRVALVSDAGTPLISDPGYRLVREAANAGHRILPVPGASATLAALSVAGLPTDRYTFVGFLPEKPTGRRNTLTELSKIKGSLVIYESARRLPASIADIANAMPDREIAVARELTKRFEEVRRGLAPDLAAHYQREGPPKGEVVLVIGPAPPGVPNIDEVDAPLRALLETMSVRDASTAVATMTGVPKREVYTRALALTKQVED